MYAHTLKLSVIEDSKQMREMIKDHINHFFPNSEVKIYPTGEAALADMSDLPDAIVLDYHLDSVDASAMNGLQVLKKIKEKMPDVPVIIITAEDKAEVATNTMKYGAYDYIVKNDSAFQRLSLVLNNIHGHASTKKNLGMQKFFNGMLLILVVATVIGLIFLRMS